MEANRIKIKYDSVLEMYLTLEKRMLTSGRYSWVVVGTSKEKPSGPKSS